MPEKYVVVEGFAGLGNRLRTIAAAIEYSQKTGRILCINWRDGMFASEKEEAFSLFFDIHGVKTIDIKDINKSLSIYPDSFGFDMFIGDITDNYERIEINNFYKRKILNYSLRFLERFKQDRLSHKLAENHKYFRLSNGDGERLVFGGELKKNIDKDVIVFVDNVPGYNKQKMLNHIHLKPFLDQKINMFVRENELEYNSLGLHIRATDKNFQGTLDRLFNAIENFMKKKQINKIFLCTDNKDIEKKFLKRFTKKIVIYPKTHPNENIPLHYWVKETGNGELAKQMAMEAILDMFILSRTEYMLSQLGSTFSEISSVYHEDKKKQNYWQIFQFTGCI